MEISKIKSAGKKMNRTWKLIERDRLKKTKWTKTDEKKLDSVIKNILKFRKKK